MTTGHRVSLAATVVCGLALGCSKEPSGPVSGGGSGGSSAVDRTGGRGGRGGNGGSGTAGTGGVGGSSGTGGGVGGMGGAGGSAGSTTDAAAGEVATETGSPEIGSETGPSASFIDSPMGDPPMNLKDVGLFPAFPDMTQAHPRALLFRPKHELWSNGLGKARFAVLPQGQKVDTSTRDAWNFPVGSLFFKTFFQDPGPGAKARPVETRLIRRKATEGTPDQQWEFFVWRWNDEGTEATLIEIRNRTRMRPTVRGTAIDHDIPRRSDCWNCHIANKSPIIGFDELRLNMALEGKTETQLQEVIAKGWLTQPPAEPFLAINDANVLQRQVKEWIHGNCAHCHNGEQVLEPGARYPALDLRHDKFMESAINKPTMTVGTAVGTRIVPGQPVRSILFLAVEGPMNSAMNAQVKIMPPVGVNVTDPEAITRLRQWIMSLPPR